jgi:hypothetical protein
VQYQEQFPDKIHNQKQIQVILPGNYKKQNQVPKRHEQRYKSE